jgi:hypothetical protein
MNHGRLVVGITLVAALAMTGCAGKFKLSSKTMCEAHGGTYNTTAKTCSYTQTTRSAQQICQQQRGSWDSVADMCEMGMD